MFESDVLVFVDVMISSISCLSMLRKCLVNLIFVDVTKVSRLQEKVKSNALERHSKSDKKGRG